MAIFGRKTARQRLARATRESLTIPAFSSPVDCTPWVIGGLWPVELSTVTADKAALAEHLRADLQRIADAANIELQHIGRAVMADSVRRAEEARIINSARVFAIRRVESTVRHLREATPEWPRQYLHHPISGRTDSETTQLIAAVTDDAGEQKPRESVEPETDQAASGRRPEAGLEARAPEGFSARHAAAPVDGTPRARHAKPVAQPEYDPGRLAQLLEFVARQEPGLRWAVGNRADGTTVVATDLAHGWIPPGIVLPAGVRLLVPERRAGNATALLGSTTRSVEYTPGGAPLSWAIEFDPVEPSTRPRELPAVDDLGWLLGEATHWRDGLPRMVHTLAKAGAAGTGVVEAEIELLRVHLDTTRYQLLAQYPDVDAALLLNCLLLAATEGMVSGDVVSANYHFAWFRALSAPPVSRWAANP